MYDPTPAERAAEVDALATELSADELAATLHVAEDAEDVCSVSLFLDAIELQRHNVECATVELALAAGDA